MKSYPQSAFPSLRTTERLHPVQSLTDSCLELSHLQRAVEFLLSSDVKGVFLIVAHKEEIAAAERWLAKEDDQCISKHSLSHYAMASILMRQLKNLNGALLTSSLHQYFMTIAESRNIESQLYVMRLLIHRLPENNYRLLRDMALLLFKQADFGNNWAQVLKLGSLFGPLIMKQDYSLAVVHKIY